MERYELEEALEKMIAQSGVSQDEVIDTLEMMLERYREDQEDE